VESFSRRGLRLCRRGLGRRRSRVLDGMAPVLMEMVLGVVGGAVGWWFWPCWWTDVHLEWRASKGQNSRWHMASDSMYHLPGEMFAKCQVHNLCSTQSSPVKCVHLVRPRHENAGGLFSGLHCLAALAWTCLTCGVMEGDMRSR